MKDTLHHHGVKGMRWGVRKQRATAKKQSDSFTVKTKYGDTINVNGNKTPKLALFISKYSKGVREQINRSNNMSITDKRGNKVGDLQLYKESKDSINVVWVGVNEKQRGYGYATATMKGVTKYAKSKGYNKVTLEVPGNSPDAKHIYTSLGFKEKGSISDPNDPIWGGLTKMELDLRKRKNR